MPASIASASSFGSSFTGRSIFSRVNKYELKKKFYEKVDDFDHKLLLHSESGMVLYRARCSYSGAVVGLKGYMRESLTPETKKSICHEVKVLQNNSCPFILKCFDAFEDQGMWWLVLENASYGDLYSIVKDVGCISTEGWVVTQVLLPLIQTVAYLHNEGIIHRDIKPENIFFNSEKVAKLSGFFLAVDVVQQGLPKDLVGSLDYVSPEVFILSQAEQGNNILNPYAPKTYDYKIDIWQIGILAYDLLVGHPPFNSVDADSTAQNILNYEPTYMPWMSNECIDFISQALSKDPADRPAARALLHHPWISFNMGWKPPDDFDDPIQDFDTAYYEEGYQHEDEFFQKKWYNPFSWFRKDPSHQALQHEQDLDGTGMEKQGFVARMLGKKDNLVAPDTAFGSDKIVPMSPPEKSYGARGPSPLTGTHALPAVGSEPQKKKYSGATALKGSFQHCSSKDNLPDDFSDGGEETMHDPSRNHSIKVGTKQGENDEDLGSPRLSGSYTAGAKPRPPVQVPALQLPPAGKEVQGSVGQNKESTSETKAGHPGPKAPSKLEDDCMEEAMETQQATDRSGGDPVAGGRSMNGLNFALDMMISEKNQQQSSKVAGGISAQSAAAAMSPKPPPLPLHQLSNRSQESPKPGIGSFRAGKDSPFNSSRRDAAATTAPGPSGSGTPRSARSNLAMQGVQEPPIPGNPGNLSARGVERS